MQEYFFIVDLVMKDSLKPALGKFILEEAQRI